MKCRKKYNKFLVWLTIVTNGLPTDTLIYDFFFLQKFIDFSLPTGQQANTSPRIVQRSHLFSWSVGVCFILSPVVFQSTLNVSHCAATHTDAGLNGNSIRYSQKQIRWNDIHKQSNSIRCNGQMVSSHFSCVVVFFVTICKRLNIWPLHEEQQTAHIEQCLNGFVSFIFAAFFWN